MKKKLTLLIMCSMCFILSFFFDANAYTITYIKDQASKEVFTTRQSTIDPETGKEVFVLIDDKPIVQNFSFVGWRMEDSTEVYSAGRKIKAERDLTVTGQFSPGTCQVSYPDAFYSDEIKVIYGNYHKVRTFGEWYGREFDRCDVKDKNNGFIISYAKPREYIEVTSDILIEPVWKDYDKSIFAKDIYFGNPDSIKRTNIHYDPYQAYVGNLYTNNERTYWIGYTMLNDADSLDNAITDIMYFEYDSGSYHNETSKTYNGLTYTFAINKDTGLPHNLRQNFPSAKLLFLGYAKSGGNDKVMAHSITSRYYDSAYFNDKYKLDDIRNAVLSGMTYKVETETGTNILVDNYGNNRTDKINDITYNRYDITNFIPYYSVHDCEKKYYDDHTGLDWMASIPDNYYITEINIPGTHDSGAVASKAWSPFDIANQMTQTQYHPIYTQLERGCRYLDIRTYYEDGLHKLIHGSADLKYTDAYKQIDRDLGRKNRKDTEILLFEDALFEAVKFVTRHPTETVLFAIQADREFEKTIITNTSETRATINKYMYDTYGNDDTDYFETGRIYIENRVPTLGEVRGKVVILDNWWHSNDVKTLHMGLDNTTWGSASPRSSNYFGVYQYGEKNKENTVIENQIKPYFQACEYMGVVFNSNFFPKTLSLQYVHALSGNTDPKRLFYYNNTQCRSGKAAYPKNHYGPIHDHILKHDLKQDVYYGVVTFDFGDLDVFRKIYITNLPSYRNVYR